MKSIRFVFHYLFDSSTFGLVLFQSDPVSVFISLPLSYFCWYKVSLWWLFTAYTAYCSFQMLTFDKFPISFMLTLISYCMSLWWLWIFFILYVMLFVFDCSCLFFFFRFGSYDKRIGNFSDGFNYFSFDFD